MPVQSLLDDLRCAGNPVKGAKTGVAGSVQRGCAVQFSARYGQEGLSELRFNAFGGPAVIAACEHCCRVAQGAGLDAQRSVGGAAWLSELQLARSELAQLLIVEDAWRALLTAWKQTGENPETD